MKDCVRFETCTVFPGMPMITSDKDSLLAIEIADIVGAPVTKRIADYRTFVGIKRSFGGFWEPGNGYRYDLRDMGRRVRQKFELAHWRKDVKGCALVLVCEDSGFVVVTPEEVENGN